MRGSPSSASSTIFSRCSSSSKSAARLNGFCGDTTNHISSSPALAKSWRASSTCPLCMGLKEPPKMPVVIIFIFLGVKGVRVVKEVKVKCFVAYCQTSIFGFSKLWYVTARLMCRLIYNLPELSIRIFNPITSYFLIKRYEYRIENPDIRCCRIFRCAQQHVHIRQNISFVDSCGLLSNINL